MSEQDRAWLVSGVAKSFRSIVKKSGTERELDLSQYAVVGSDLLGALTRDFDWQDSHLSMRAIELAVQVGGPEAVRLLARIPHRERQTLSALLVSAWSQFPGTEYADTVLAGLNATYLEIRSAEQLDLARVLGKVDNLSISETVPVDKAVDFAAEHGVRVLGLPRSALRGGDVTCLAVRRTRSVRARSWYRTPRSPTAVRR